ncbi:MAG: hypothetical protein ACRDSF_00645 [Pseudonocardiaceae bacterium]
MTDVAGAARVGGIVGLLLTPGVITGWPPRPGAVAVTGVATATVSVT